MNMVLILNIILVAGFVINGAIAGFNALNIIFIILSGLLLIANHELVLEILKSKKEGIMPIYRIATYVVALILALGAFNIMPQSQAMKDTVKANKAYKLIQTGKINDAVSILEKMKERLNNNSTYHQNLAVAYLSAGYPDKAKAELDVAFGLNPSNYSIYFNYGMWAYNMKDYKTALSYFETAAEMNPAMISAYVYAGTCCRLQGNIRAAIYYYSLAKRYVAESLDISYLLGKAYYDLDEFDSAQAELKAALSMNPSPELKADIERMLTDLENKYKEATEQ